MDMHQTSNTPHILFKIFLRLTYKIRSVFLSQQKKKNDMHVMTVDLLFKFPKEGLQPDMKHDLCYMNSEILIFPNKVASVE